MVTEGAEESAERTEVADENAAVPCMREYTFVWGVLVERMGSSLLEVYCSIP